MELLQSIWFMAIWKSGWCAGQDVKQWVYDITDWVDNSTTNNLVQGIIQRTGICATGYQWWWKGN